MPKVDKKYNWNLLPDTNKNNFLEDSTIRKDRTTLAGIVTDLLKEIESPKVLDAGGGTGVMIKYLPKEYLITIVDITEDFVNKIPDSANITKIVADFESYKGKKNSFDLTFQHGVLEHTWDPSRFIKNLINLTKSGGYIILSNFKYITGEVEHEEKEITWDGIDFNERTLSLFQLKKEFEEIATQIGTYPENILVYQKL